MKNANLNNSKSLISTIINTPIDIVNKTASNKQMIWFTVALFVLAMMTIGFVNHWKIDAQ